MEQTIMKHLQNDDNQYAILALNTGESVEAEHSLLEHLGLKPLKVLQGVSDPSYLVKYNEPRLVHDVAGLYGQESILVLRPMIEGKRKAEIQMVMDITQPDIHGTWHNCGTVKPTGDGYTYDGENYYTIL